MLELKGNDYQAQARNKLIAEAFYLTGDIEKYGSGFLRIRNEISTYLTMTFEFEDKPSGFVVTLGYTEHKVSTHIPKVSEKWGDRWGDRWGEELSKNQINILTAMIENDKVTHEELATIIKLSTTSIENNIKKLRQLGIVERIGPARGGYWKVNI